MGSHGYGPSAGMFRHPLIVCEVERIAVAHQMILMYDELFDNFDENLATHIILKKYKRFLHSKQLQ